MEPARPLTWILALHVLLPLAGEAALEPKPPEPVLLLETAGLADRVNPAGVFGGVGNVSFVYYLEVGEGETADFQDDTLRLPLWRTDGTPAGTFPLLPSGYSLTFAADTLEGVLIFGACFSEMPGSFLFGTVCTPPLRNELWRTDGTAEGTYKLLGAEGRAFVPSQGTELVPELGLVFFRVSDRDSGSELWATDGTLAGTRRVKNLASIGYRSPRGLTSSGGALYFLVTQDVPPDLTWWGRSDGTSEGTRFFPAPFDGEIRPLNLQSAGDRLFFLGVGPEQDSGSVRRRLTLWSLGREDENWRAAGDLGFWSHQFRTELVAGGGRAFVYLEDFFEEVATLWGTDGASGDAELLATLPWPQSFLPVIWTEPLTLPQGRAFIRLSDETHGSEPWISDGTAAGTSLLADLCPGECGSFPFGIATGSGDSFLFLSWDGRSTLRRWHPRSGVVELVADLCLAGCPEGARPVGRLGERYFFLVVDSSGVARVWEVDEASNSVQQVADLGDLEVSRFQVRAVTTSVEWDIAADRWVFWGRDPEHGLALWSLQLPTAATSPPPGPALTSDQLPGFAVKVRIGGEDGSLGRAEADCLPETLCVSGALPGRSEVFVRIVGPKPNGKLWPTLVKFTTSEVEVWIEQLATGIVRYYQLEGAAPGSSDLPGLFDRGGFSPTD